MALALIFLFVLLVYWVAVPLLLSPPLKKSGLFARNQRHQGHSSKRN
jgi:hypothetical protein